MREPRLLQPLFQRELEGAPRELMLQHRALILAYDSLWNLLFHPSDMTSETRLMNAQIALQTAGATLEDIFKLIIFDLETQEMQLTLPLEEANNQGEKPCLTTLG